jgi:hypothetical protein
MLATLCTSALKTEAACSFETLVSTYLTIRHTTQKAIYNLYSLRVRIESKLPACLALSLNSVLALSLTVSLLSLIVSVCLVP